MKERSIVKLAAVTLSSLLIAGATGRAWAQSAPPTDPNAQEAKQQRLDRDKVTLRDRVQESISSADANIDALKNRADSDKGATWQHDKNVQKKLSDLRGHLKRDLSKIDEASVESWDAVHAYVSRDLGAMEGALKEASVVTNIEPPTGTASEQAPID